MLKRKMQVILMERVEKLGQMGRDLKYHSPSQNTCVFFAWSCHFRKCDGRGKILRGFEKVLRGS